MEKVLKLYKYVDGNNDVAFPNVEQQVITSDFRYDVKRMGGAPMITCTIKHELCLDKLWTDNVYAMFNGERFFIKQVPTSSYDNTDCRYKHDVELVSERIILDNVYFYDVVDSASDEDKPVSNSSSFTFFGDIHQFVSRLNESLDYSKVGYSVVVDGGISSEDKHLSFQDQFFSNVLQEIYNTYQLPYYFEGKVIHVGYTSNAITHTMKYGDNESLLSIQKQNANYKIVNRVTGVGSQDNIPYYYPNEYESKAEVEANGGVWVNPQTNLMPPIYRDSLGSERFYNALNETYISPETKDYYTFDNPYVEGKPKEHIVNFEDIKPTIKGVTNASGERIDMFVDFAYDDNDNDEIDDEGNYKHPYFFAKLRKFDGVNGFNLFEHAIDEEEMSFSLTSGSCGACEFVVGVEDGTQKNPVQVDVNGNLMRNSYGNVMFGTPQDRQNDTRNYEVWVALKKDVNTFGIVMPNATNNYKPSANDTFVILHINLPKAYIVVAENKLKDELIKYMALNNNEKFVFSIAFSRIFFAENPLILEQLDENARLQIEYDEELYELYVSSYSYVMSKEYPLPEIRVELSDTLTISQNALQNAIDEVKKDIISSIGSTDFLKKGLRYFLRKDVDDRTRGLLTSDKGFQVGEFVEGMLGGSGAKMYIDNNGKTIIEADKAYFREEMLVPKITFNSIDVMSGEMAQTFAYGTIKSVDTATQIATLDLLDDEYGTLHVYDILRGTFHRLEGGNNTEYSKDKNGFHNYSGFSTSYFTPTEILVNEKGHMEFRYVLQDADGMHPCAGMNFYAYGNFYDKDRQSVTYQTREYTRRLRNMGTWIINPSKNIAMQVGNLNDLEVGNFKMSGWGTFETNSYLMGTQIQFTPDQLDELKGLNGADAYSVTLSSYDGIVKVDAEGNITSGMTSEFNVVTGSMNVVTGDDNVVVTDFRLKTTIQASKGSTPLFYSTGMEEGSYMAFIASVGCDADINNGVVSVTEITDLKNASLTITVVCEGSHSVEQVYRINAVYDGDSSEIETIYSKLKEPAAPENVHPYVDNDVWSHDVHEDNIWMAVSTRKNNEWTDWQVSRVLGVSSFKSTAFIRTNSTPATPTGGSYESPLPTDEDADGNLLWSDGIPEGESILWASVCTFHSNGHYPEDAKWSTPRALTDTADFEAIYSPKEIHEEIPSGFFKDGVDLNPEWESSANAAGWYDDPNQWNVEGNEYNGKPTVWMATNTAKNGVWEGWRITRVLGEKGADAVSYEITPPSLNLRETLTGTVTPSATVFTCYASNKEERVETEATWGIKGRKDGQEDWITFDYSHVGTTMTFEPNQHDRYDEYLITAIPKGQTTALEVQIISTKDRRGVMPRYCGRWKEGAKYYYNDEVRDIVTLGGNVFQVYPYNPNGYVEARPNPDLAEDSHDDYWEKANKFSFVAMDTALIDSAHIAGFTFFVDGQDAEGNPLGRMESANKKIVLDTVNERIISTDAEISGSINVGSLSYKVLNANGGIYDLTDYGMVVGWGTFKLPSVVEAHSLDIKIFFENWSRVARDCKIVSVDNTPIRVIGENGYAINVTEYLLPDANTLSSIILVYDSVEETPYWMVNSSVGASTGGGISLFVDNKLDAESEYPVQNKVIYEKFQSLGPFTYNKDLGYWTFNGDLLVQGGVTSHANEGRYTPSTIMDGVQVDGTTIIKDEYGNLSINPDIEIGGNGGGGEKLTFTLPDGSTKVIYDGSTPKSVALTRLYKSTEVSEASSDDGAITPLVMRNWTSQRYVTALGLNGDYLTWTLNGEVKKITVPYATTAKKLSTINKKAWGQTYLSSEGIPVDVSGDMEDVGSISMEGQLCFNDAVSISSNDNTVVINPSKSSTEGQAILGVNGKETIFASTGGVNVPNGNLTLGKLLICQTYKDFAYINQLKGVKNLLKDGDLLLNNIGYFVGSYSYDDSVVVGKTYKLTLCAKLGENSTSLVAYWDGGSGNNTFVGGLSSKEERVVSITARITQINSARKLAFYQQPNASPYGSYVKWAYLEEAFVASDFSSTSEYNQWLSSQKEQKSTVVMDNIEMIRFGNGNDSNNVSISKVDDCLRVRGNFLVTGGVTSRNVTSSSDIRYKDVHKNLELSIDKMADAPNFEFHFIDDEEMRTHVGTSAQYWQDLEGVVSEDSDGKLGLDYSSLGVSMGISLARKLREALREIERLKEEINTLKRN